MGASQSEGKYAADLLGLAIGHDSGRSVAACPCFGSGLPTPPPPQSARQALIEMFMGKGSDDFAKHLPEAARQTLIRKGETPEGSSFVLRSPPSAAKSREANTLRPSKSARTFWSVNRGTGKSRSRWSTTVCSARRTRSNFHFRLTRTDNCNRCRSSLGSSFTLPAGEGNLAAR